MVGSNNDTNATIMTLTETSQKLGASTTEIQEAQKYAGGSNTDASMIIGLLKLIASLVSSGGSGGEFTEEDRAKLDSIPTLVSQLTNDSGYITKAVGDLANYYTKSNTYTKTEVGTQVSTHNSSTTAHSDIRALIEGLTTRLNALANSDDTTLDQMSEIVAYIKSNKSLIDSITTGKVSVTDIVDNLTTNVANKPLSAKQGVALKALIDAVVIPNNLVTTDIITLGTYTDGLVYVFVSGVPVGTGISISSGEPTT